MDFYELIRRRHSIRSYDRSRDIPPDVLQRILDAGRVAPSAANRQPWRFLVVKREDLLQKIYDCYKGEWLRTAPAILIVIGDKSQAWVRKRDDHNSIEVDLTIAMDHMILAATAEGLGTCWILAYDYEKMKACLSLKTNEYISCITPLGYPGQQEQSPALPDRKPLNEISEIICN